MMILGIDLANEIGASRCCPTPRSEWLKEKPGELPARQVWIGLTLARHLCHGSEDDREDTIVRNGLITPSPRRSSSLVRTATSAGEDHDSSR